MNIIHTADWHLGQNFFGYEREEEHKAFLKWLIELMVEKQTDVLLIAGDVFDVANPSAASQHMFFSFLREAHNALPTLQIVVIAGNHDSAARLEAPEPLMQAINVTTVGVVKRKEDRSIDYDSMLIPLLNKSGKCEALCMAVPYLRQGDMPSIPGGEELKNYSNSIACFYRELVERAKIQKRANELLIAMGHLHLSGSELSDDDRSERVLVGGLDSVAFSSFPEGIAYIALGHIHKAQRIGGFDTVRYAGSPLPMSFSEQRYKHQVVSIEVEDGKIISVQSETVPVYAPLLRISNPALPPEEVLTLLEMLPIASDKMLRSQYPYLEVRVLLREPEPTFRNRVEKVLEDKAVRLTSIIPVYEKNRKGEEHLMSYADLQNLDPTTVLQRSFTARYGCDLPDDIKKLFQSILSEVDL